MQAGNLRHKVEIQEPLMVKDTTGARPTVQWQTKATARMDVRPVRGSERATAQQAVADFDYRFIARYRPWLTPKHRLVYAGNVYDIEAVNNIAERHRSVEILAKRAA